MTTIVPINPNVPDSGSIVTITADPLHQDNAASVDITLVTGKDYEVVVTRRTTNRSQRILLTVNRDDKVVINGVAL